MEFRASARILAVSWILSVVLPSPRTFGSILTDRLSHHDLKIWHSITRTVLAQDSQGHPRHPKTLALWRSLQASGHEVHIDMIDEDAGYSSQAGKFFIEVLDPAGLRHICVIRLNLATIRRAYAKPSAMHPDGFVPMAGLGETGRYTEVLGHEMAHAFSFLQIPDFLGLYLEKEKEVAEYERLLKRRDASPVDLEVRLAGIRNLLQALEKPAEAAEAAIWSELSHNILKRAML